MTVYRANPDELTIPFGPGSVHLSANGRAIRSISADVALKLVYENNAPGATRAVLELVAEQVEPGSGHDEIHVLIELTEGDLLRVADTAYAIRTAAQEDNDG